MIERIVEASTPEARETHAVFDTCQPCPVFFCDCRLTRNLPEPERFVVFAEALLCAREVPDARGRVDFRIDATIISTDVESVTLDKDRGAERAVAFFAARGPLPRVWRSVGDSRSDYLMADHLFSAGFEVAHVDVRPADGILKRVTAAGSLGLLFPPSLPVVLYSVVAGSREMSVPADSLVSYEETQLHIVQKRPRLHGQTNGSFNG